MKTIGLTGGIGTGKTFVANIFNSKFNIPIYNSDIRAKELMTENKFIKDDIINFIGKESYINGEINKLYISKKIFSNKFLLSKINSIVHPKVKEDFEIWKKKQKSNYVIIESAILFESEIDKICDFIITITSDLELRVKRIIKRDNITKEDIFQKMKTQNTEEYKIKKSNFIIENNINSNLIIQIDKLIYKINENK